MLRNVRPEITVVVALLADTAVTIVAAALYGLPTAVLLGLTAGLAQSFGKLSLDALIQREIPDHTRASAFARSETLLQLSWVVGGFIGIALPLVPQLGLGVAAAILAAWCSWVFSGLRARPAPDVIRPEGSPTSRRMTSAGGQSSSSSASAAEQHRGRLGALRVGVTPGAVALLDVLEQPVEVLDDVDHVGRLLAQRLRHRLGRLEQPDLERLVTLAALHDPELHPGARLQRR